MRRIITLVMAILLISPVFGELPTKYLDNQISVVIHENELIDETREFTFPYAVDQFNYYIIHRAVNVHCYDSSGGELNCELRYEKTGTLVSCSNFSSTKITMTFQHSGLVTGYDGVSVFSDRYIISTPTENFNLKIFLPQGYILAGEDGDPNNAQFYPESGVQKTDGRSIYIEWTDKPKLGKVYDVSVFYEPGIATDQFLSLFAGIIVIGILLFVIFFLFLRRRRKPETFGLTEDERKFLGALSKENKVSQKKIARDINLSKAQTSRIAASLEKRGLIERIRRGRNYEVSLK